MAESLTLARPYAQAVFRLAKESRSLTEWSSRLRNLAAIAADPEMGQLIGNPQLSARQVADLFISLLRTSGEAENRELSVFVTLLAENGRFDVLPEIGALFESLKDEDEAVREAVITSAFPLDKTQLAHLLKPLETHFHSRLRPQLEVDPALIGGIVVTVGDQVLDASVRGKLGAMSVALKN